MTATIPRTILHTPYLSPIECNLHIMFAEADAYAKLAPFTQFAAYWPKIRGEFLLPHHIKSMRFGYHYTMPDRIPVSDCFRIVQRFYNDTRRYSDGSEDNERRQIRELIDVANRSVYSLYSPDGSTHYIDGFPPMHSSNGGLVGTNRIAVGRFVRKPYGTLRDYEIDSAFVIPHPQDTTPNMGSST